MGLSLLFKEALRPESPKDSNDVLMARKIVPARDANHKLIFLGEGQNPSIASKYGRGLKRSGIHTDWKRFESINEARNDVEQGGDHSRVAAIQCTSVSCSGT
jgi:hypothetical protein